MLSLTDTCSLDGSVFICVLCSVSLFHCDLENQMSFFLSFIFFFLDDDSLENWKVTSITIKRLFLTIS